MSIKKFFQSGLVTFSAYAQFACVAWSDPVPYPDYSTPSSYVLGDPNDVTPPSGGSTSVVIPQDPPASFGGAGGMGGAGGSDPGFVHAGAPSDPGDDVAPDASVTASESDGGLDDDTPRDAGTPP